MFVIIVWNAIRLCKQQLVFKYGPREEEYLYTYIWFDISYFSFWFSLFLPPKKFYIWSKYLIQPHSLDLVLTLSV